MSLSNITMIALASPGGLTVASSVHEWGTGWPTLGQTLDTATLLRCARMAGESGATFSLSIIGDGEPSNRHLAYGGGE